MNSPPLLNVLNMTSTPSTRRQLDGVALCNDNRVSDAREFLAGLDEERRSRPSSSRRFKRRLQHHRSSRVRDAGAPARACPTGLGSSYFGRLRNTCNVKKDADFHAKSRARSDLQEGRPSSTSAKRALPSPAVDVVLRATYRERRAEKRPI